MSQKHIGLKSFLLTALIVCCVTAAVLFVPFLKCQTPPVNFPSENEVFLNLQQRYSRTLEKKILNLIEPLVGKHRVRATAQVELNLKNAHHYIQAHSAEAPLETTTKTWEKDIQNFIQRQHISVVVDGNTRRGDKGIYQPRAAQEMQAYKHLIQSAIGFDAARGDTLEIQNIPFAFHKRPLSTRQLSLYVLLFCVLIICAVCLFCTILEGLSAHKKKTNQTASFSMEKLDKIIQNPARTTMVIKNWLYLPTKPNSSDWTYVQKAGIVLLSLDEEIVRHILVALDDDEVRMITKTMVTLGVIPPEESARILNELYEAIFTGSAVVGNPTRVQQILAENLNQKSFTPNSVQQAHQPLWQEVATISDKTLTERLNTLAPELTAYILYQLPTEKAAHIVQHFAPSKANQVLIHLSHIGKLSDQTNEKMAQEALSFARNLLDTLHMPTGAEKMSDILAQLSDTDMGQNMIQDIAQNEPSLAKNLAANLIQFEDLGKWSAVTIQTLLKHTPRSVALTALAGAKDSIKKIIRQNVPAQMWPTLEEEIKKNEQSMTADQILAARKQIVEIARSLLNQGKIAI